MDLAAFYGSDHAIYNFQNWLTADQICASSQFATTTDHVMSITTVEMDRTGAKDHATCLNVQYQTTPFPVVATSRAADKDQ
jgi:ferritin